MNPAYDVIVIGGGSTGENVADRVVKGGLSAVLVEGELVGGDCSFWACVPSKTLLRPYEAIEEARSVPGAREAVNGTPDPALVLGRRDRFVSGWKDDAQTRWLSDRNIELVRGHAKISGERRVSVGRNGQAEDLTARHAVVVCTGSKPFIPDVPGIGDARIWTSRDATSAREAPRRLAILGGGPVACEMATAWRRLGTEEIVLVERGPRLLPRFEPFAGEFARRTLESRGARVLTDTAIHRIERLASGELQFSLDRGERFTTDRLLAAAGRRPRTDDLGLEKVGIKPGAWLEVDETMRVRAVPAGWLYAAGDVNRRALLTHMGKYQARVCGDSIVARAIGRGPVAQKRFSRFAATADHDAVPQVVFTDPPIAAVGLSERDARARGIPVRAVEYDMGQVSGASIYADGYDVRAKIVVNEERGVVIGMTIAGACSQELIHSATIAIVGEVPIERLWHAVPSFPTISEVWLRLLETLGL